MGSAASRSPRRLPGSGQRDPALPSPSLPAFPSHHPAGPAGISAPGISSRTPDCHPPRLLPGAAARTGAGCFSTVDFVCGYLLNQGADKVPSRPCGPEFSSSLPGGLKAGGISPLSARGCGLPSSPSPDSKGFANTACHCGGPDPALRTSTRTSI